MNNKSKEIIGLALTVFGFVSSAAQTLTLSTPLVVGTLTATCLSICVGIIFLYQSKKTCDVALIHLGKLLPKQKVSDYCVRHIRDVAEFNELSELDAQAYGEAGIPYDVLLGWWQKYPNGPYCIFKGDACIGGIGLWPLKKSHSRKL